METKGKTASTQNRPGRRWQGCSDVRGMVAAAEARKAALAKAQTEKPQPPVEAPAPEPQP